MYAHGRERQSGVIGSVKSHNPFLTDSNFYQLFLQFYGPTTILLQTRASRMRDVLKSANINEIADAKPGTVHPVVTLAKERSQADSADPKGGFPVNIKAPRMSTASIGTDGKVTFEPIGPKT